MAKQEVTPVGSGAGMTIWGTDNPDMVIQRASKIAKVLQDVVDSRKMYTMIGSGKHLRVEAWQTLGAMTGIYPATAWTRKIENGWEARVEAFTRNGELVGAAESECLTSERNWAGKDDHALRSMAQTRAMSKALSMCLRFIVSLAGYEGTPAEEMPQDPRPSDAFRRPQERTQGNPVTPQGATPENTAAGTKPTSGDTVAPAAGTWTGLIDKVTFRTYQKKGRDGKPTGEEGKTYSINTTDGKVFKTWSDTFAKDCKYASENGEQMTITFTSSEFRGNIEHKVETCQPAVGVNEDGETVAPEQEA